MTALVRPSDPPPLWSGSETLTAVTGNRKMDAGHSYTPANVHTSVLWKQITVVMRGSYCIIVYHKVTQENISHSVQHNTV